MDYHQIPTMQHSSNHHHSQQQQQQQQHQHHNQRNPNLRSLDDSSMRNTNFIFPAIKVKAFYESSHKTVENRLSKKANLYSMIKLESFVMPIFTKDYSKKQTADMIITSRDMCISPALLDFLEQTLEPLDTLRSSLEHANLITTPLSNRLNKNNQQSTLKSQKENIKPNNNNNNNGDIHLDDTPIRLVQSNTETESKDISLNNNNNNNKTSLDNNPAYFPIDVVAFVSMQPSSIRFTCIPQSTMECLLKLPTLEMVFSTYKSMDSNLKETIYNELNNDDTNQDYLLKQQQQQQKNKTDTPSTSNKTNNNNNNKNLAKNSEKGGLSVTCSMTDFSLKFYNRLAMIKHNADPKDYRYEQSCK